MVHFWASKRAWRDFHGSFRCHQLVRFARGRQLGCVYRSCCLKSHRFRWTVLFVINAMPLITTAMWCFGTSNIASDTFEWDGVGNHLANPKYSTVLSYISFLEKLSDDGYQLVGFCELRFKVQSFGSRFCFIPVWHQASRLIFWYVFSPEQLRVGHGLFRVFSNFAMVQLATFGMFKQMQFCLEIRAFVHTLIWTPKMWNHFSWSTCLV